MHLDVLRVDAVGHQTDIPAFAADFQPFDQNGVQCEFVFRLRQIREERGVLVCRFAFIQNKMHHRRRMDGLEFAFVKDGLVHFVGGWRARNFRLKSFRFVNHRETSRQRVRFFEIINDGFRRFGRAQSGQRLRRGGRQIGVFGHRKQIMDDFRLLDSAQAIDESEFPIAVNRRGVCRSHRLDGPFGAGFLQLHASRFADNRIRALQILQGFSVLASRKCTATRQYQCRHQRGHPFCFHVCSCVFYVYSLYLLISL